MKKYLDMSERKRKRVERSEHRWVVFDDIGKAYSRPLNDLFRLTGFLMRMQQSFPGVQIWFLSLKVESLINIFRVGYNLCLIRHNLSIISEVSLCMFILMIGSSAIKHFSLRHLASFTLS